MGVDHLYVSNGLYQGSLNIPRTGGNLNHAEMEKNKALKSVLQVRVIAEGHNWMEASDPMFFQKPLFKLWKLGC